MLHCCSFSSSCKATSEHDYLHLAIFDLSSELFVCLHSSAPHRDYNFCPLSTMRAPFLFSLSIIATGAGVLAWHCPNHPHVSGELIYLPACCDNVTAPVHNKFNATSCYQAFPDPLPTEHSPMHEKKNYTCELDGTTFGEGPGCCQDLGGELDYKCVSVLNGPLP